MQLSHPLGIVLPITTAAYRIAQQFAQQCPVAEKAAQIRQNTLAVCAVNAYLEMMDIPTALQNSDSWNPILQLMANVADLRIPGVGTLSCRAVAPQAQTCYIPPEDSHDRAGYIAVMLDEQNHQATLIGFTKTIGAQTQVALSQFAPIETLIDRVHSLNRAAETSTASTSSISTITQLEQWVSGQIEALEAGWQQVENLLEPTARNFAFRRTIEQPAVDISRAKSVNLGLQFGQSLRVALVIHLTRAAEDTASSAELSDSLQTNSLQNNSLQTNIVLQVHPLDGQSALPTGLVLNALDDQGEVIASATSRAIDSYIQLELSGETGEQFGVQIVTLEARFEERFAI